MDVFNRNNGLICESFKESDLLFREGAYLLPANMNLADCSTFA